MDFLSQMAYWHWLILGAVLMAVEAFAPGAFFLWPGISAVVVGLVKLALPGLDWQVCVATWAILSLVMVVGWIMYRKNNPSKETPYPNLNRRAEQYVGRRFTLDTPVVNGKGEMRVDDGVWRVLSDSDFPVGTQVKVISADGNSLHIVRAE
jgi:membrane protein implicated in regulation of membrane protease activity